MSPTLSVHATYAGMILGTAAYMSIRRLLRRCLQNDPQKRLPHIGAARLEIDEARAGSERAVKRLSVSGGAPVTVCPSDNPFGLSWGEAGILFGQPGKGIMRVSPNGGAPDVIVPVQADEAACCPQMLPGGAAVLFTVSKNQDPYEKARVVAHRLDTGARITVIEGGADGRYMSTGHVVYALAGVLLAVPFDAKRLQTTGGPVPVVEGVRRAAGSAFTFATGGIAHFSVAESGTIAYLPGPASLAEGNADLGLFDRSGKMQALKLPPGSYRAPRISPEGRTVAFDREDARDANIWLYDLAGGGAPCV